MIFIATWTFHSHHGKAANLNLFYEKTQNKISSTFELCLPVSPPLPEPSPQFAPVLSPMFAALHISDLSEQKSSCVTIERQAGSVQQTLIVIFSITVLQYCRILAVLSIFASAIAVAVLSIFAGRDCSIHRTAAPCCADLIVCLHSRILVEHGMAHIVH